jgi:hypothetical protein
MFVVPPTRAPTNLDIADFIGAGQRMSYLTVFAARLPFR